VLALVIPDKVGCFFKLQGEVVPLRVIVVNALPDWLNELRVDGPQIFETVCSYRKDCFADLKITTISIIEHFLDISDGGLLPGEIFVFALSKSSF
jgi:hypothetical protein